MMLMPTKPRLPLRGISGLLLISLITGCAGVRRPMPGAPVKVAVPQFLQAPPVKPSWRK